MSAISGSYGGSGSRSRQWPQYLLILLPLFVIYGLVAQGTLPSGRYQLLAYLMACVCLGISLVSVQAGLLLIVFAAGVSPEFGVGTVSSLRFEDLMIPSVFGIWLMRQMSQGGKFVPTRLKVPILVYLLIAAVSTLHNVGFASLDGKTSFFIFFKYIEYLLLLTVVANLSKTERQIVAVIAAMMLSSLIAAAMGGYQHAAGLDWGSRATGPEGETANIYGGYLLFNLLLSFGLFVTCRKPGLKIVLVIFMAILFYVCLRTLSRGSYIGLAAALILMGILMDRRILIWVLLFLVAAPIFFPSDVANRLGTIVHVLPGTGVDAPPSWQAKTGAWSYLREEIFQHPLLGMGVGAYPMGWVDNEYVKVALEVGLVGLLVWFWWVARMLLIGWQNYLKARVWWHQGLSIGFVCGMAGLLVHAVGATSLTAIRTMESLMITVGLMIALANLIDRKASMRKPERSAPLPGAVQEDLAGPPYRLVRLRREA